MVACVRVEVQFVDGAGHRAKYIPSSEIEIGSLGTIHPCSKI